MGYRLFGRPWHETVENVDLLSRVASLAHKLRGTSDVTKDRRGQLSPGAAGEGRKTVSPKYFMTKDHKSKFCKVC